MVTAGPDHAGFIRAWLATPSRAIVGSSGAGDPEWDSGTARRSGRFDAEGVPRARCGTACFRRGGIARRAAREFTAQSGTASAVATLELLAGKHRTLAAWSSAAKKEKSLADVTCAALLRTDVHSFLRQGPPIADYADEFL